MSSRRQAISMAVLLVLVLVLGYVGRPFVEHYRGGVKPPAVEPPLPGKNAITRLVMSRNDADEPLVTIDYFYTGEPRGVIVKVGFGLGGPAANSFGPQRGAHSITMTLQ